MVQALRLTSFSHGAGCACKLGPRELTRVLDLLGPTTKPEDVLVSEETGDDAAVYRLTDGTGLVLTLDFFTPATGGGSRPPTHSATCTRWEGRRGSP